MDIVVLLKQVPSTETMIAIADDGVSIKTDDVKWEINPYDELAVEEALRIKAEQGGSVTVLSMGPPKAVDAIRTALAMGADKGVRIDDEELSPCDALTTARVLAAAVKAIGFDLIIGGHRAVDKDHYQVGPAIAEFLSIPHIPFVVKQEVKDGVLRCQRSVDGGTILVEASLPALFTTQRGLNEPRYASLPGIMKAKKKPVETKSLADLGLDAGSLGASSVTVTALNYPPERTGGRMIEGETPQEKAAALIKALQEEAKVL